MKMICKRIGGALVPVGDESWDVLNKLVQHNSVVVIVKQKRNADLLRKYWAICGAVANFDEGFDDRGDVDHYCRTMIPFMRKEYVAENGKVTVRPRSIAEDEMSEADFEQFFERAMEVLASRIGRDPETLGKEGTR